MASGEESEGTKEAWAWPKGEVAVSFLQHLDTRLGQAPDEAGETQAHEGSAGWAVGEQNGAGAPLSG